MLIINNRLSPNGLITSLTKATGTSGILFNGDYSDFSTDWYAVVGITIFTNAFIGGISPVGGIAALFVGHFKRCLDRGCSKDVKKTKKIMQEEYEAVYTGQLIQYDTQFSKLIAFFWVIMMFSAAIPFLYLAGFILCFVLYWTDKTLFVKLYRTPPKHGSTLGHQVRSIIEWSLIMHLFMGLYMLSNPEIFTSEEEDNQSVAFFKFYAKFVSLGITATTGVDSDRFGQAHTVLYCVGVGIFVVLFILEKVSGTFSRIMGKFCCCCLYKDAEPDVFSDNIYKDISVNSQRKEFKACKELERKIRKQI